MDKNQSFIVKAAELALAPCFQGGEVPEELCLCVANGEKSRERITHRQGETQLELVAFDTDSIGSYIFDSKRLPVITGASAILSNLNKNIREKYQEKTIFSGGGEGLLLLPVNEGQKACEWIQELYNTYTKDALGVTTAWLRVEPADFAERGKPVPDLGWAKAVMGTKALLARLRDEIRAKKERMSHGPPIERGERCSSCRDRVGTVVNPYRRDEGKLCAPCVVRWEVGKKIIKGTSFEEMLEKFQASDSVAKNFQGFVYCDGNGMGELFGGLKSLQEFRLLSQSVAGLFDHLGQLVRDEAARYGLGEKQIIDLLGGGDEKIWILPASLAIEVCRRLPKWIEDYVVARPELVALLRKHQRDTVTVGTGLVICEHKYPVRYMYELACQLQTSAKSRYYKPGAKRESFLDFAVLTDASPLAEDLETARKMAFASDASDLLLTCRPYSNTGFAKLLKYVNGTRAIARSQVYQLREAAREGPAVFLNYACYQAARNARAYEEWLRPHGICPGDPESLASFFLTDPDGEQGGTWLGDAVELAPFLEKGGA